MRILVVGRSGQIAWELRRALLPLGEVVALGRDRLDLARPQTLAAVLREAQPQLVVNAAAYTAVDQAESQRALAMTINAESPGVLAREAAALGALFVHYSTDYVFDGTKTAPYVEADAPAPLNAYGESKLAGERAVAASGADHLILRTSWVYAARGANFVRTILRLARERDSLRVVADQFGAPTWARFIAEASALVLARACAERNAGAFASGLFHLAAGGAASWHDFACATVSQARELGVPLRLAAGDIAPIPASEYPLPARRPRNSRLDCAALAARFGIAAPPWEAALRLCLEELAAGEGA